MSRRPSAAAANRCAFPMSRIEFPVPNLPRVAGVLLATLFLAGCGPVAEPSSDSTYEVGQVWRYKTRPGEEGSRLHIARIDEEPGGVVVYHLFVDGLSLKNTHLAGGVQAELPHSPVGRETLDASVTELERVDADPPDVSEGYAEWRRAFDAGQGGYFTMPVADILDTLEAAAAGG